MTLRSNGKRPVEFAPASFAETLKGHRNRCGLSQMKLSQRAGVEHSTIGRIEAGSRNPSFTMVTLLADALGLGGLDRSLFFATAGFQEDAALETRLPPAVHEIMLHLPAVPDSVHRHVHATLASLADLVRESAQ